ncbi:MAG: amidohydrolase, partial [Firmicutes bacterium]|nr:amidohydrolase [Bacillota bacterium]
IVQYGYNGISGRIHGADMRIADPYEVYITQAKIITGCVLDLLQEPERVAEIKKNFQVKMTLEDYIKYLNSEE